MRSTFKMKLRKFRQSASGTFPRSWTSMWGSQQFWDGPFGCRDVEVSPKSPKPRHQGCGTSCAKASQDLQLGSLLWLLNCTAPVLDTHNLGQTHRWLGEILGDSQVKAEDAAQAEKKTPLSKGGDTLGGCATWGMHLQ